MTNNKINEWPTMIKDPVINLLDFNTKVLKRNRWQMKSKRFPTKRGSYSLI